MIGKYVKLFLALNFAKGIGTKTLIEYAQKLNTNKLVSLEYKVAIQASKIKRIIKISPFYWNKCIARAEEEIKSAKKQNISIISYLDKEYPANLFILDDAPIILYVKGNYHILNNDKTVAIIGTRKPSNYGIKIDYLFAKTLSKDGFTIVGGLAKGCDKYAHEAAVNTTGKTIAILANGLDQPIYPKENTTLAHKIVENGGALVSTYALGTKLSGYNLAARDEWQSGISDGVLAIETGIKGGTRIAMRYAKKQKRPLAVIDYRQAKNKKYSDLPTFQGNYDAIMNESAIPIFSKNSLLQFEKMMIKSRNNRLNSLK